jgi:hypothetical protein
VHQFVPLVAGAFVAGLEAAVALMLGGQWFLAKLYHHFRIGDCYQPQTQLEAVAASQVNQAKATNCLRLLSFWTFRVSDALFCTQGSNVCLQMQRAELQLAGRVESFQPHGQTRLTQLA